MSRMSDYIIGEEEAGNVQQIQIRLNLMMPATSAVEID